MAKVLVVDDQAGVLTALQVLFELNELEVLSARSAEEALALVRTEEVGVVVQDMNFSPARTSGEEGVALFRRLRELDPELPVLLLTAFTSLETAVALVKEGAADYLAKPWDDPKLVRTVKNLLELRHLKEESTRLQARSRRDREALAARADLKGLVYASGAMHQVVSLAVQVAASEVPVLITGPNGGGKEKLAEIVQANSRRKDRPFVRVNAGGLPDELLEAELFGAEAGAYTGSTRLRVGRFETAHGGTLFLDEIGNLSPAGQARLLRVLQTGEYQRLGSSQTRTADFRLLSATNADLKALVAQGRFREDLYFRLDVIELAVPPLRERLEDVLPLAEHFLAQYAAAADGPPARLSAAARQALLGHGWPGNVRELQNRIQRAAVVRQGPEVSPSDLGLAGPGAPAEAEERGGPELEAERQLLEATLERTRGVVSRAAAELGLSRQAFYRRLERAGLSLERRPRR